MIEVRLRHVDDARAVRLFDWDPADLDSVVRVIAAEGVRDGGGNEYAALDQFQTQIVYEDGEAFFEVTFGYGING